MIILTKKIINIINKLENYKISLSNFVFVFLSICFVRNFMEGLLGYPGNIGTGLDIKTTLVQMGVLFNLEWITLFLYIVIIIYFLTKTNIVAIFRISLIFFILIIIVPFLDYFIYPAHKCKIDYLYSINDYINALVYFFIPFKDVNVCAGIRIEVFLSSIFIFIYIFIKTNNIFKSLSGSILLYFLAISSMAFPVFILLLLYPLYTNQFDSFVNNFFFSPSFLDSFLNKISVMITMLLIPSLLLIYKIYFKNKKFIFLIKNLFSFNTLTIFFIILIGFVTKIGIQYLFNSLFNIIFLLFLFFISFILNLYFYDNFTAKINFKNILFILLLIFSFAISFNNLLVILFLFAIWNIFRIYRIFINNIFFDFFIYVIMFIILFIFGYTIIQ